MIITESSLAVICKRDARSASRSANGNQLTLAREWQAKQSRACVLLFVLKIEPLRIV
jgi:hypothetical protein